MAVNVSCCDILQAARDWQWRTVLVDQTLHCNCSVSGLTDLSDKAQRQRAVYHLFFFFFFFFFTLSLLIGWWTKLSFKDRLPWLPCSCCLYWLAGGSSSLTRTVYPDNHAHVVFTDQLVDQVQLQGPSTLTTMFMLSLLTGWWIKFTYKDRLPWQPKLTLPSLVGWWITVWSTACVVCNLWTSLQTPKQLFFFFLSFL